MLLAPDLRDWLGASHPARWVDALVEDGLDLSGIYADYTDVRGGPPYDPRLMLKILIYGYSHGITSSRALERRCQDDIAFRFLTAQAAPDFVVINRFRARHGAALKELFTQSLTLCANAGLVSLGRVALDGTKVRASASRHRAMSYERMVRAESELAAEVEALLADAQRVDAAEDAAYGPDRRGDELPAELSRREGRLAAIRKAKAALEAEHAAKARAQAEQASAGQDQDPGQVAAAGDAAEAAAVVPDRAQRSFTDPDARIMKTSDGSFHYCFNGQAVVDEKSQVVLVAQLGQSGADSQSLPGMLTRLAASLSAAGINGSPRTLLADAGYFSEAGKPRSRASSCSENTSRVATPTTPPSPLQASQQARPAPSRPGATAQDLHERRESLLLRWILPVGLPREVQVDLRRRREQHPGRGRGRGAASPPPPGPGPVPAAGHGQREPEHRDPRPGQHHTG